MAALRLMTFNVQMLPLIPLTVLGQSDDAEERAERVANAILSLPVAELPDVIAFNEVFNEDGRDRLKDRLSSWPNVVVKIDNGGFDNDSGLMLFSRLPFHTLPTGGELFEHFYSDSAGTDSLACKAVGIVQVNRPAEITTIAFTHMQASYAVEDEHRDVRKKQFQEIFEGLAKVLGPDSSEWRNVILVGDLNVRGDSEAETDEWTTVFQNSGTPFQAAMSDGWRAWMHPPGTLNDPDPGWTNIDLESGKLQRLDYQCFSASGIPATGAVAHHMFVRLRDQSDHFALESVIERWSLHCTPMDAIELEGITPWLGSSGSPTSLRLVPVNFESPDSYQWLYAKRPGTYTVHAPPDVRVRLFLETDLSHAILPSDTLSVTDMPAGVQAGFERLGVDPKGTTLAARLPFFLAVETRDPDAGPKVVTVYEHLGESPATAIWLVPHVHTATSFPPGQPLGTDDTCWMKAEMPPTFGGQKRTEKFTFSNDTGNSIEIAELDTALQVLNSVAGNQSTLDLLVATKGDESRLFRIKRSSYNDVGFACHWFSPVCYLALDQPIGFYVRDESGIDWGGDDEISLDMFVDNRSLFSDSWDSADTGERWPGFVERVRDRFETALPGKKRLPFCSDITLSYVEDDITASGWLVEFVQPLAATDLDTVARRVSLPIPDTISDGMYTFYCSLSRFPE